MDELTLVFDMDTWLTEELEQYLLSLTGIIEAKVSDEEKIYIKYNSKIISIKILKLEILAFISKLKIPSLISFYKHPKDKTLNAYIIINDICCEYCYKAMIQELLLINGIESAHSEYTHEYNSHEPVKISITYNNKMITKEKIKEIEIKLNSFQTLMEED